MITMLLDESSWYIPATHKIKQATKIPIPWMQIAVDLHTYCCSLDSWYVCVCVFVSMSFVVVVVVCFAFHTHCLARSLISGCVLKSTKVYICSHICYVYLYMDECIFRFRNAFFGWIVYKSFAATPTTDALVAYQIHAKHTVELGF